jgi:hypothetical protein
MKLLTQYIPPSQTAAGGNKQQQPQPRQWQWGQRHHAYYHPVRSLKAHPINRAMLLLHFVAFWGAWFSCG